MAFDSNVLQERLQTLLAGARPKRWIVALSGGMDSSVLLHALVKAGTGIPILAVHIDHGLHPDSKQWREHAGSFAAGLGIEFIALSVTVDRDSSTGLEAAAREARYAALGSLVGADDWVLSGHHENDQAETLLLNLMRGSGPAGIAGIGARIAFGNGVLARPLLGVAGEDIEAYARRHALAWIDDPSNEDPGFDRNFVRHEVMRLLKSRWPAVANRLRQSAELAGEAGELLQALADIDIAACGASRRLSCEAMRRLSPARQRNLLRRAVQRAGLPPMPATRLYRALDELLPARRDAQPLIAWSGGEMRRYADTVYLMPPLGGDPADPQARLRPGGASLELGAGLGRLRLVACRSGGLDPVIVGPGLRVRFREGGEAIRIAADRPRRKLKKLLQEHHVLPWMRDRLPLMFVDGELVAVGDLWVSADHVAAEGFKVEWRDQPAII